ncbi:MAG: DinB family protein [Mycobacteriales bacterium]
MTIVPDTKDWTWVLTRPCAECGFDAPALDRADLPSRLRQVAAELAAALSAPDARQRPVPTVWSALEYGCHVRDVFRLFRTPLELILGEDDPLFPNWDQDETAIQDRYGEQDPTVVSRDLVSAAERLASAFEDVPQHAWQRPGRRSDGAAFTLTTFSQYLLNDPVHHLWDVQHPPRP